MADVINVPKYEAQDRDTKEVTSTDGDRRPSGGIFRQRRRIIGALAVVALGLMIGGFLFWLHYTGRESTDDAQVDAHIDPISARMPHGGFRLLLQV